MLTYEMRCGRSPFESQNQMEMFKKITQCDFVFPRYEKYYHAGNICDCADFFFCVVGIVSERGVLSLLVDIV